MTKYLELVATYEVDVRFPDVSGMEHLDMLRVRSELANYESELTVEERMRLLEADKALLRQVRHFYKAIHKIADLEAWRRDENIPITHWWWYLDVLAQIPELPTDEIIPEQTMA
jgi:hypothetical protein